MGGSGHFLDQAIVACSRLMQEQTSGKRSVWAKWKRQSTRLLLATGALGVLLGDGGISSDELACELAVDHMLSCCPELSAVPLRCVRSGCGGTMVPDLSEDRAACLRDRSCSFLRGFGVCDVATWQTPADCAAPCEMKVPKCE